MRRAAFQIAVVQMACSPEPDTNLANACDRCREAARAGAKLICLPELFRSRYFCQSEDHGNFALAEPIPGPSTEELGAVAREFGVTIIAPVFERRAAGVYHNSIAVIDADGTIAGVYRKMHIPDDPLYYEKFYFTPGDLGFRSFPTCHADVGTLICWDQWYPEAARITALQGANVLCYPTAIGWHPFEKEQHGERQHSGWETIQRSHAIANGVYVATANRVGHEGKERGGIQFWGASFICDPFGAVLAKASHDREEILYAVCDPALQEETRQHWPFLRDRRIDAYGPIMKRFID